MTSTPTQQGRNRKLIAALFVILYILAPLCYASVPQGRAVNDKWYIFNGKLYIVNGKWYMQLL